MTDLPDPPEHDPHTPAPGDRGVDARALDADERALAERIASTAPQRGPSAELDARILAMARAPVAAVASVPSSASAAGAVAGHTADANAIATAGAGAASTSRTTPADVARARRRRRWPAMAGIAATLTLTFGLAWQMRPQDAPLLEASEAVRAPSAKAPGASGPQFDEPVDTARAPEPPAPQSIKPEERTSVAAADAVAAETTSDAAQPAKAVSSESRDARGVAPSPSAPIDAVEDAPRAFSEPPAPSAPAPAPMEAPLPVATPAPPPPPAPSARGAADLSNTAPAAAVHHREAETKQRRPSNPAAEADAAAAKTSDARPELDRVDVTGSRIDGYGDQPLDDQPPASADSPAVREAWLARVRQLIADGRTDDARDSLHEYRRRHPDAPIPDDLRPLLPAE